MIRQLQSRFGDQRFDFADACVMWLAEREGIDTVFTLDRRDFEIFRKRDGSSVSILP